MNFIMRLGIVIFLAGASSLSASPISLPAKESVADGNKKIAVKSAVIDNPEAIAVKKTDSSNGSEKQKTDSLSASPLSLPAKESVADSNKKIAVKSAVIDNPEVIAVKKTDSSNGSEKKKTDNAQGDGEQSESEKKEEKKPLKKEPMTWCLGAHTIKNWVKLRLPEFFYGKNLRLINNDNPTDRVLFFRHVLDLNTEYRFINADKGYDIIFAKMNIRDKGVWGDPESIAATTSSEIKLLDSVVGSHSHAIPRHIFWIRELWAQFALCDFLNLDFCNFHTLSIGAFPFELGRGISLGAAYAVDPSDLGFYSEAQVDQYAFGAKLTGEIFKDRWFYDLYASILNDQAASFSQTNEKVRGQQYFHRNDQARGFGSITYLVAGRFRLTPIKYEGVNFYWEPYALYYHNPEGRIEFARDSKVDLITIGVASESEVGKFEWGFDTAFNLGRQTIRGWDTNVIRLENRDGFVVEVNSKVRQVPPGPIPPDPQKSPLALKTKDNQAIINLSEQSYGENCKIIGEDGLGTLVNDCSRFVDPYHNSFGGSMMVFDCGYYICKPDLKVCAAFGYASGDKNPNRDLEEFGDSQEDGDYLGFIGLQEVYSGTRVKSAFLLAGSGKIPRLLSFPARDASNPFVATVSRFTNIIYTGGSLRWAPEWSIKHWTFNPNLLFYWQHDRTGFFDTKVQKTSQTHFADPFLGTEINIFIESEPIDCLRFFAVGAIFIPGQHYKDVKGRPLNRAQQAYLDNLDRTGIVNDRVPLLGDDLAYFANIGLEYKF